MNEQHSQIGIKRYRSILVPLDGSDVSEQALPVAVSLARQHGAALHLVRVYVPIAGAYGEHAVRYDESLDRELMQRARSYLDDVVAQLVKHVRTDVNSALIEGWVPEAIAHHARTVGTDLLVMTTRSRSGLARFWLGSVSEALLRQAEIPILFVPPGETPPSLSDAPTLRRVLIPLDGSDFAEQVLDRVDTLTAGAPAEYTLLRVFKPMTPTRSDADTARVSGLRESLLRQLLELDERESAKAQAYVERVAESLRAGVPAPVVHTRVVSNDRPADAVLHEAARDRIDVIALATHGRSALKRLLVGSTTDKILRGAEVPVLVYRPTEMPAQAA